MKGVVLRCAVEGSTPVELCTSSKQITRLRNRGKAKPQRNCVAISVNESLLRVDLLIDSTSEPMSSEMILSM